MKGCLGRLINCLKPQASIDGVESLRTVGLLGLRVLGLRVEGLGFRAFLSFFFVKLGSGSRFRYGCS